MTRNMLKLVVAVVLGLLCMAGDLEDVVESLRMLQPSSYEMGEGRAEELAKVFLVAEDDTGIGAKLLVAIAMRESSLSRDVEEGIRKGSVGEIGLMQVHPRNWKALSMRPEGCTEELEGAYCQIMTGARYLKYVQELCGGSLWRVVGSYGHNSCMSPEKAGMDPRVRIAARYHKSIGGIGW